MEDAAVGFDAAIKPASQNRKAGGRLMILLPGRNNKSKETNVSSLVSPSEKTEATMSATPSSYLPSPDASSNGFVSPLMMSSCSPHGPKLESLAESFEEDKSESENDEEQVVPSRVHSAKFTFENTLSHTVIDSIITEEVSLGAPSDEEEMHELHLKNELNNASLRNRRPHPIVTASPLGDQSQSRIKILSRRITAPESIVFRPSLVAPPSDSTPHIARATTKTSVNPQTIANFNKLKIQVQLANRADKHKRRKVKLEDRFEDVKGYRNLWSDFEDIQQQVEQTNTDNENEPAASRPRGNSMNLKETKSWYFDFHSLNGQEQMDDDDDNRSQSSMSLLSEVSREAQRQFYEEKRKDRNKRRKNRKVRRDVSDDRSVNSAASVVLLRERQTTATMAPSVTSPLPSPTW